MTTWSEHIFLPEKVFYSLFVLSMLFFEFLQVLLVLFAEGSGQHNEVYDEDDDMDIDKTIDDHLKSRIETVWKRDHFLFFLFCICVLIYI